MEQQPTYSEFGKGVAQGMRELQDLICQGLTQTDPQGFAEDPWNHAGGGGGRTRVIEGGEVFEKGGVLFSGINGTQLPKVITQNQADIPPGTPFFATGVSLIMHPRNPYVPTVHFNVRYFELGDIFWFGGGMDLTPFYPETKDCQHFHQTLKNTCDAFDPASYPVFKKDCDDYFYIPHRKEHRGVGGIFFNELKGEREATWAFVRSLGQAFLDAYQPIVAQRKDTPYGERERDFQNYRRGRYVEFNLTYDKGTLFGLQSGGRTESILVSMPPQVVWRYNWHPEPGTPEAKLTESFLTPRDWV